MDAVYENFAITDECLDERLGDFDSTPIDYEDDSHGSLDSLGSNSSLSSATTSILGFVGLSPHRLDLTVVFDMDHTIVGDLQALSDRDNLERNLQWPNWPAHLAQGVSPEVIEKYLLRGMLRPGFADLVRTLVARGARIIVYTHSEEKWAARVLSAVESLVDMKFISHVFSRKDCKDHHPHFSARKSLRHVVQQLDGHAHLDRIVMFDDDANVLGGDERQFLVPVPAYNYWEKCPWDEVLTPQFVAQAPAQVQRVFETSVRTWQVAPPSYGKSNLNPREVEADLRWAQRMRQKEDMRTSMNAMELRDDVMVRLTHFFRSWTGHDDFSSAGMICRSDSEPCLKPSQFSDLMTSWPQSYRHSSHVSQSTTLSAALKGVVSVSPVGRPAPCLPSFGQFFHD